MKNKNRWIMLVAIFLAIIAVAIDHVRHPPERAALDSIAEEHEEGILLRPATVVALEIYTDERKAEFLLSNAIDAEDYARAVDELRKLGLDPDDIPHYKPKGV